MKIRMSFWSYFGQITLLIIAIMQMWECSASTCLAALSSLNNEFFDMKRWASGSKSYCRIYAIIDIAFDASFVI